MQDFESYFNEGNLSAPNARAYREALIYLMINYADKYYRVEGLDKEAAQTAAVDAMSFDQKRRYRNEIFRIMSDKVKAHNQELARAQAAGERMEEPRMSIYNSNVAIDAFFESSLGKAYADKKKEWTPQSALPDNSPIKKYLTGLANFTVRQSRNSSTVVSIVSPYDPLFIDSDGLSNTDELGYILASKDADGNYRSPNLSEIVDVNGRRKQVITSLHMGRGKGIASELRHIDVIRNRNALPLYGDEYDSGFSIVDRHIKNKAAKLRIKDYMIKTMNDYADPETGIKGRTQAPEQYQFIDDMLKYLDEKGVDYEIQVDSANKLVAKIGSRTSVRLLDRAEPEYRGRVYDKGTVYRVGVANVISKNKEQAARDTENARRLISNEDCMSVIKWRFGEPLKVDVSDFASLNRLDINALGKHYVGEDTSYHSRLVPPGGNIKDVKKEYTTKVSTSRSGDNSSVLLSLKRINRGGQDSMGAFKIMISPSAVADKDDLDSLTFASSLAVGFVRRDTFEASKAKPEDYERYVNHRLRARLRFPESKIHPDDFDKDFGTYTYTEDGVTRGVMLMKTSDEIPPERIDYYNKLAVREELNAWVESARDTHASLVGIDDLIAAHELHGSAAHYEYDWADDDNIAEIQKMYWRVLSGEISKFSDDIGLGDMTIGESAEDRANAIRTHYAAYLDEYIGSVPEILHDGISTKDNGSKGFVPENVARYVSRHNSYDSPRNISYIEHMLLRLGDEYSDRYIKGDSYQANLTRTNLVSYCGNGAKELANFSYGEVMSVVSGDDMHPIDRNKVNAIKGLEDKPFTREMLIHTMQTLIRSGCDPKSVRVGVDENGIISYSGNAHKGIDPAAREKSNDIYAVHGTLGRVIEPGKYGELVVKTPSGDNKVLVPGYDAYFVSVDPENPQSRRDRLRLIGYDRRMKDAISENIRKSVYTLSSEYDFSSHTADLNSVYKNLTATSHDYDEFYGRLPKDPATATFDQRTYEAVIKTETLRCRFPTEYGEHASTDFETALNNPNSEMARNFDYYYGDLCEKNIRDMSADMDDVFDPVATGTARNQGVVRFLVEGAEIDPETGKVKGTEEPDRTTLMKQPFLKYMQFDPFTRQTMCFNTVMSSKEVCPSVNIAFITLKGWNFDDAFIVSKKFAEAHMVDDREGNHRALKVGDKISDTHGNKGVMGLVVDPDMLVEEMVKRMAIDYHNDNDSSDIEDPSRGSAVISLDGQSYKIKFDKESELSHAEQAAEKIRTKLGITHDMDDIMRLFKDNPSLEVVGSPYSPLSRLNGGTIVEAMESPQDLIVTKRDKDSNAYKETIEGGMGGVTIMVTDMLVTEKTHIHDKDALLEGKGRSASGQLTWFLQCKNCNAIVRELYGDNNNAINNLREHYISWGLDIDPLTNVMKGYQPQPNEYRRLIKLPDEADLCLKPPSANKAKKLKASDVRLDGNISSELRSDMLKQLNETGGFLELPFKLNHHTEKYANRPELHDFSIPETGHTYTVGNKTYPTYGMPVLPPGLRSGQELHDGTVLSHSYTTKYVDIYKNALLYIACEREIDKLSTDKNANKERIQQLTEAKENAFIKAQSKFDDIMSESIEHWGNSKHNDIRDEIMKNKQSDSFTAVWTPDPRLGLDEVSMSPETAAKIDLCDENGRLKKDASIMIWRDPCQHDGNIRYMKVVLKPGVDCISINPLVDKSFDGDFDGDAAGGKVLHMIDAKQAAKANLTFATNLIDVSAFETVTDPDTGKDVQVHPLYMQTGMDVMANAYHLDKALIAEKDRLTIAINRLEESAKKLREGVLSDDDVSVRVETKAKTSDGKRAYVTYKGEEAINIKRAVYANKVTAWSKKALDGIAVDCISVKDAESVIRSLEHSVESGAKGDPDKLDALCGSCGIEYKRDADGKIDYSTVSRIVDDKGEIISKQMRDGTYRDETSDNSRLQALKTDDTASSGTDAQHGVYAHRDSGNEILKCTEDYIYPCTQGVLQSKKNAADAFHKDTIIKTWGKDVIEGYKLTGFDFNNPDPSIDDIRNKKHVRITERVPKYDVDRDSGEKVPRLDANGNQVFDEIPVKCTRDEWIYELMARAKGLNVSVNREQVETMVDATLNPETHRAYGLIEYGRENGSLLDKAAYLGKVGAVVKAATSEGKTPLMPGLAESSRAITGAQKALKEAKATEDSDAIKKARGQLKLAVESLSNSAAFAPNSLIKAASDYAENSEESLGRFKPIGRKDCLLTKEDLDNGVAYMGESQADYEKRLAKARKAPEATVPSVTAPVASIPSEEPKPVASTIVADKPDVSSYKISEDISLEDIGGSFTASAEPEKSSSGMRSGNIRNAGSQPRDDLASLINMDSSLEDENNKINSPSNSN